MTRPRSYLLCGTPRTGSTLLCSLLSSTGVAGHPESYFRQPDEQMWARRFGVPVAVDGSLDYAAFAAGARRQGSTPNGVFAARIMWGTVAGMVDRLTPADHAGLSDLDVLVDAFGPLEIVHLRRVDVLGQAVSWARAEQTSYWQPDDVATAEPEFDIEQVEELVRTIGEHNAAWSTWFAGQGVHPLTVTYEDVVAHPRRTVEHILSNIGVEAPPEWRPAVSLDKQADEVNADWLERYSEAHPTVTTASRSS